MEETILTVLRGDHERGWHLLDSNRYCPICQESTLVQETNTFLKFVGNEAGEES